VTVWLCRFMSSRPGRWPAAANHTDRV